MASTTFVDGSTLTAAAWFNDVNGLVYSGTVLSNFSLSTFYISRAGTAAGLSLDASNNATLSAGLTVSGTGPHAIGGATQADNQFYIQGTFAPSVNAVSLRCGSTLTVPANGFAYGAYLTPTLNRAGSGTHADFASLVIDAPTIGAGAAAITNATTVKITGAPSSGTNQRALWVSSGVTEVQSVGLGAASTGSGLTIGTASTNNTIWNASQGAGTATLYIGNASINVTSDERLKKNIQPLIDGLSIVNALLPIEFDQDEERPWGEVQHYVGLGARHTHKVAPWAVHTQGDTGLPWKIRQEFLMAPVVRALQQINERLIALEVRFQ